MGTTTYAVLLRGVNVAGHRRVGMADLRELLEDLGYTAVSTYLQSGNAIVTTAGGTARALERAVEAALGERMGVRTDVLVRSAAELAAVIEANPFPEAASNPKNLHVAFLSGPSPKAQVESLDPTDYAPDRLVLGDRVAYLHYANGSQRSKLGPVLAAFPGVATTRNWNTVQALALRAAGG